jgi:hypothetical protein
LSCACCCRCRAARISQRRILLAEKRHRAARGKARQRSPLTRTPSLEFEWHRTRMRPAPPLLALSPSLPLARCRCSQKKKKPRKELPRQQAVVLQAAGSVCQSVCAPRGLFVSEDGRSVCCGRALRMVAGAGELRRTAAGLLSEPLCLWPDSASCKAASERTEQLPHLPCFVVSSALSTVHVLVVCRRT